MYKQNNRFNACNVLQDNISNSYYKIRTIFENICARILFSFSAEEACHRFVTAA